MFEQYRGANWRIRRVSWFASQRFAYTHVILPASNSKVRFKKLSSRRVKAKLKRAHKLWFRRLKELVLRGLWLPTPDYNAVGVKQATVKRCMYCPPTNVTFYQQKELYLCGRRQICPFCFFRESEELYRRFSKAIRKLRKNNVAAKVTYRCATYLVTAREFQDKVWTPEQLLDHVDELQHILKSERRKFALLRPKLRDGTFGSLWRIIVNPVDTGWEIHVRQLFITRPKASRPINRAKKSATIFLQSANIDDFSAATALLGKFVEYPRGLLISYAELVAVFLRSRENLRLLAGTGCLYAKAYRPKKDPPPEPLPFLP